ncbi:MAG: hypothetical protein M1839_003987 [Geoglossum umbratile]|nr:MAG: hypothetical protein M1839_003987 [Geoglossum umbratile]
MPKRESELENNQEAISGLEKRRKIDCGDTQTLAASASKQRLAHENYTVGWICAISTEYIAATEFLDEEHERPECVAQNDNNDYTLGRVGKHNIVIAVLPNGEYGTASAASVARDILHSFPNVRIGLMVGIGGGAPSRKYDIRLGDIVVSAPHNGDSGVFQYDFGKTIQNQSFQHTRFLNQPPTVLQTAVNGLKAQYEREGHPLEAAINTILNKKLRLQKKYKRPDSSNDRLYRSGVTHPPNNETSCMVVCGNDPSNLISRPERTEEEDNPAIHYGTIASANQLMKDASVRDKLVAEKDILCFEMEAAGLVNHFPCLVIRGICDYSDSHKNKEWQGYAAMVAAAYAKDLLCRISPKRVEVETKIVDILSNVLDAMSRAGASVEAVRCKLDREKDLEILNWLTPIDYGPQQSDYIKMRQAETGQWFLNSEKFRTWLKASKQTLFCPGIPGAGKTIITSIVVNYLHKSFFDSTAVGIAYIYCNFRQHNDQKAEDLLASLLKQLTQCSTSLPDSVKSLYDSHKDRRTRPSFDELSRAIQSVAAIYSRVFIIVDALDECQVTDGCRTTFVSEIFKLQVRTGANILATSRFIREVEKEFEGSESLEIRADDGDVQKYLDRRIAQLFYSPDPNLGREIKTEISKATAGMFLLAKLHLDSLSSKTTPRAIKLILERIRKQSEASSDDEESKVLNQAYADAMTRINDQKTDLQILAKKALLWIVHSKRPLNTLELRHALAVETGKPELDKDNIPETKGILSVCAGLVTVDKESNIIRLVHYTAQKYFEQTWTTWFPDAQTAITKVCVTYLLFDTFETGFCPTDREFDARLELNPLYDYAARNWGHHARAASAVIEQWTGVKQLIQDFLENETNISAASQAMMASRNDFDYSQTVPRRVTGVHLAAYFGLGETIISVLKNGYNPDVQDSYNQTPLSWAAREGHDAVVKLLLAKDEVDINSRDSDGWTPLSWAAEGGHKAVVELLAMDGVDINSKDSCLGRTALSWAAGRGHRGVVELLVAKDRVNVNSTDSYRRTALSWAAEGGHEAVVKLLLAKDGVDINSKDSDGRTALSLAAGRGHEAVVELLLTKGGVDINSKDSFNGWTALLRAAEGKHEAVVKLLLAKDGLDINFGDYCDGRTALSWAVEREHESMVKLLLAKDGLDISSMDSCDGRTALSLAAGKGHEALVKLLLAKDGIDINSKDSCDGRTALSRAAEGGHKAVVELLLAKDGVDINSEDSCDGCTAFSQAAGGGYEAVIEPLLAKDGVDINSKGSYRQTALLWVGPYGRKALSRTNPYLWTARSGVDSCGRTALSWADPHRRTALSRAAGGGHEAVVKLLLGKDGVGINSKDSDGWTALLWATERGHKAVVKLLLAKDGVDVNSKDSDGRTALLWAAAKGHEAIARLLLTKDGIDINSKDSDGWTALLCAESGGHEAAAKLLLTKDGVDINPKDPYGWTALLWAAWQGHEAVVKLLLAKDGVDVNSKDSDGRMALSLAAWQGHEAVVKLLLAKDGVHINSRGSDGRTALLWAELGGHEAIAKLLLTKDGVDINPEDPCGWTALLWAAWQGHEAVVKLLLAKDGVDINSKDSDGQTALSLAAGQGHEAVVKLLLAKDGVHINSKDSDGRTALSLAAWRGHEAVVKLIQPHSFLSL